MKAQVPMQAGKQKSFYGRLEKRNILWARENGYRDALAPLATFHATHMRTISDTDRWSLKQYSLSHGRDQCYKFDERLNVFSFGDSLSRDCDFWLDSSVHHVLSPATINRWQEYDWIRNSPTYKQSYIEKKLTIRHSSASALQWIHSLTLDMRGARVRILTSFR